MPSSQTLKISSYCNPFTSRHFIKGRFAPISDPYQIVNIYEFVSHAHFRRLTVILSLQQLSSQLSSNVVIHSQRFHRLRNYCIPPLPHSIATHESRAIEAWRGDYAGPMVTNSLSAPPLAQSTFTLFFDPAQVMLSALPFKAC